MKVIPLKPTEKKAAAAIVARAFFDYPSLKAYFPQEKSRNWKLPWYMARVLESAMRYGEVMTTDDLSGVLAAGSYAIDGLGICEMRVSRGAACCGTQAVFGCQHFRGVSCRHAGAAAAKPPALLSLGDHGRSGTAALRRGYHSSKRAV